MTPFNKMAKLKGVENENLKSIRACRQSGG